MVIDVTDLKQNFPEFHRKIQTKGNLNLCLGEFDKVSNKNKTSIIKANIKKLIKFFN